MTSIDRKAIRDAWQERTRSVFVIVSITVGIAALLAFLGSYGVLAREINRGFLATNPASAVLHTDSVDEQVLRTALADPEVGAAEARRTVVGRVRTGPAQWHNLVLFVIPNSGDIHLNTFVPEKGHSPPAAGEVLIERDAFQVARAKIGDTLTFRTNDGQSHVLRVSGRVHDVGQAQARMENLVYGYITVETLAQLTVKPSLDLVLIQVARNQYNEDHIRQVAARMKQRLEADGHPVTAIDIPPPGKHPHADLMSGLLLAISSFGFFLLSLSGILTLNFMTALMAGQVQQIGIMKALGASRLQLGRIYLLQSFLLGCVATAIAWPLGIWGSHLLCVYMAAFLNFDISSFAIPLWVFLVAAAAGIAVPLAACAIPLWRATAIPVRRALASSGTPSETFGTRFLDRALARIGGAARPVLLAVRNSFRRRVRLALTCLTLTCAVMFFMAALNLRTSMMQTFDRLFAAQKYDLTLNLQEMYPKDKINRALQGVPGVLAAEEWIVTDGGIPSRAIGFTVDAIPPDSTLLAPVMAEGRSLRAGDTDSVVFNSTMAAQNPELRAGTDVRLRIGSKVGTWRLVGICREPMRPPPIVYVPIAADASLYPGMANIVKIALKDPRQATLESVRSQIDPNFDAQGIRISGGNSKAEFRAAVDQHVLMIYVFLVLASCVFGGVGALGLMTTMGINVLERRREIGILRAVGATPAMVSAMVMGEAVTIAVIAWIAALFLAVPLTIALTTIIGAFLHTGFDVSVAPVGLVISLGASAVLAVLASVLAALSAVRLTVREALMYG